jgi:hypothetical protein
MSAPSSSNAAAAPPTAAAAVASATTVATAAVVLPDPNTLMQAAKLAIMQDKPILLDYFADSMSGKAFVGQDSETHEKMLVKSAEEFTSLIQKTFKVGKDYIIMTENSIYIASGEIKARKIHASSLKEE